MSDLAASSSSPHPADDDLLARPLFQLDVAQAVFRRLTERARLQGVTLRPPPPEPTTCCGRGCNGCVWEGFYAAATHWRDEALLILDDGA